MLKAMDENQVYLNLHLKELCIQDREIEWEAGESITINSLKKSKKTKRKQRRSKYSKNRVY